MPTLPAPVPELPVTDIQNAAKFYVEKLGFTLEWTYEDHLAGIAKDEARIFLRRRTPEEVASKYAVLIWLNMDSVSAVDDLHAAWRAHGVNVTAALRTTPHDLREFVAEDLDGNSLRVFFDLGGASRRAQAGDTA